MSNRHGDFELVVRAHSKAFVRSPPGNRERRLKTIKFGHFGVAGVFRRKLSSARPLVGMLYWREPGAQEIRP